MRSSLSSPVVALQDAELSAQALQQLYDEAERHYRRGEDVEALRIFSSLIELAPQYRDAAWLRVGNIHQRAGAAGAALDAYRNLLAGDPERPGTDTFGGASVPDARGAERGSVKGGRTRAAKGKTDPALETDVQRQALRLKGMVNLLTLSVAQTQASLEHIALLQQDPAVRAAAGLTDQAEAALVDSVLAQVGRIQQMLGGVPATVRGAHASQPDTATIAATTVDAWAAGRMQSADQTSLGRAPIVSGRGQQGRQGAGEGSRPRPTAPEMLIGYPVDVRTNRALPVQPMQPSGLVSADFSSEMPAAQIVSTATGDAGPKGVPAERIGQGASIRPVIEYLDEAPAAASSRRNRAEEPVAGTLRRSHE